MIVLDASAALELLFRSPVGRHVELVIDDTATSLHAPHLLGVEVTQVLRKLAATGVLSDRRAAEAVEDLAAIDIAHYEHEPLLPRMWELRSNLTAYDAAYVALAELLDARLVTLDRRLADAPGHHARVELVGN